MFVAWLWRGYGMVVTWSYTVKSLISEVATQDVHLRLHLCHGTDFPSPHSKLKSDEILII